MQLPQFQAHAEMEERHWWFLARRRILQTLLHAIAPPSKDIHLIDVGCGTGGLTDFFSREYSVTGVDPSEDAIAFAKQKFPYCAFIRGNAPQDARGECSRADVILLIEVLEHVKDDVRFVHDLIAAMKPGAHVVMIAPADMSLWSPHDDAFEHFRRYGSIDEFRGVWKGAPVEERLVSFMNSRLRPVIASMRKMSALRGKSWGKGGTDIDVPMKPINTALRKIFAGEARVLLDALRGRGTGYRKGVSVIAVLRKCVR